MWDCPPAIIVFYVMPIIIRWGQIIAAIDRICGGVHPDEGVVGVSRLTATSFGPLFSQCNAEWSRRQSFSNNAHSDIFGSSTLPCYSEAHSDFDWLFVFAISFAGKCRLWIFIHVALPTSCVHQAFDFDLRRCKMFWIMFWS